MELPQMDIFYENLKSAIFERVGRSHHRLDAVERLGLLTDDLVLKRETPIDTLSHFLAKKLQLGTHKNAILHFAPLKIKNKEIIPEPN